MKNADKPAFTILDPNGDYYETGLSKREYFAMLSMQAILSNSAWAAPINKGETIESTIVKEAIAYADELF